MSMNTKPNLFIACAPLHIINAIEAIHHFHLKNNILVIVYRYDDNNNKQMDYVAKYYHWKRTFTIGDGKKKSKFFDYLKTIKHLNINNYNYIFCGGYSSVYDVIIANLNKNIFFILDDGVATIDIYNKKLKNNNKVTRFRLKHARFWLFGLKTKSRDKINFFTYFDLKPLPHLKIVHNNLSYFKKKYVTDSVMDNSTYFLGHPHRKNAEHYTLLIENFIKSYNNKIIYVPHRSEVISHLLKKLLDDYKIEIKYCDMPIEMYFLFNKITPYMIAGFNSTAFFTLKFLYPYSQYKSIYSLDKNDHKYEESKEIYKYIYSIGIEKINL